MKQKIAGWIARFRIPILIVMLLIAPGFIILKICTVFYIADIGALLARGALVSALRILTLLPALLALCDRWAV